MLHSARTRKIDCADNVAHISLSTMPAIVRFIRPIFFVRWLDPKGSDLEGVQVELEAACGRHGGPVIYVAIVPVECTPPDEKARAGFVATMREVLERCETMHFVMEGQGFKNAILRTSLATVLLVRGQRAKVSVHNSLEEALTAASKRASKKSQFSVASMVQQARESGIATGGNESPPAAMRG